MRSQGLSSVTPGPVRSTGQEGIIYKIAIWKMSVGGTEEGSVEARRAVRPQCWYYPVKERRKEG